MKCPTCVHGDCEEGQSGSGQCHCSIIWTGDLCDSKVRIYIGVGVIGGVLIVAVIVTATIIRKCRIKKEDERKSLLSTNQSDPTS